MNSCCYSGDLVEEVPISRSTLSQHLKELKYAGLIQGEINPPYIKYCINRENWEKAKILFLDFLNEGHLTTSQPGNKPAYRLSLPIFFPFISYEAMSAPFILIKRIAHCGLPVYLAKASVRGCKTLSVVRCYLR